MSKNYLDTSRFHQNLVYYTQGILEPMNAEFSRLLTLRRDLSQAMYDAISEAEKIEEQKDPKSQLGLEVRLAKATENVSHIAVRLINLDKALSELALAMTHTANVANCNR